MVMDIRLDDVVRLRKVHPCGSYEWRVVRLGADIGIKCLRCERRVLLERPVFERRVKQLVSRGVADAAMTLLDSGERPDDGKRES